MGDCRPRLTTILPCTDLSASESFFNRLGFHRSPEDKARVEPGEQDSYRILVNAQGEDIHLTDCPDGWLVPNKNPFGLYLYVEDVDSVAMKLNDVVIEKTKKAEHKQWRMYEVSLNGLAERSRRRSGQSWLAESIGERTDF
jgi:hypothetical protein